MKTTFSHCVTYVQLLGSLRYPSRALTFECLGYLVLDSVSPDYRPPEWIGSPGFPIPHSDVSFDPNIGTKTRVRKAYEHQTTVNHQ